MTDTSNPTPLAEGQPWTLYVGDARAVLASMPGQSANCIVTSPPYWGKRDYGVAGQYGHEDSPGAYVDTTRDVFREARRVLADDGTCWINLGDSYSASGGGATGMHAYLGEHITTHRASGLGAKNLLGLPWRVAFALQDDRSGRGRVVARYGPHRPPLDDVSRSALNLGPAVTEPAPWYLAGAQRDPDESRDTPDGNDSTTPEGALWLALCTAPDEGADIAELMRLSGMTRPTLYRHLAAHAQAGRAIQVSRGRWRATTTEDKL